MHLHGIGHRFRVGAVSALALLACAAPAGADPLDVPSLNIYGSPGLIDTPTADQVPDATLSTSIAQFGPTRHTTLGFQITPRLSGSFRYSRIDGLIVPNYKNDVYYDRSFDLRFQLVEESDRWPGVTVGMQDFLGTSLYEAEYIVATKAVTPQLRATAGLGWGRLGGDGSIGNTGDRPTQVLGQGGIPNYDRWFRGDVAAFGGLSWTSANKRWALKAEYSSDLYSEEVADGIIERDSPWNFGVDYRLRNGAQLSAYSMFGTEVGVMFSLHTDVTEAQRPSGTEPAPLPVAVRPAGSAADLGWQTGGEAAATARTQLIGLLTTERLEFLDLTLDGTSATLRIANPTYDAEAQAIGRAARAMTRVLPASVETFVIVPTVQGMATSRVTLRRSDLEALENAPAADMLARARIDEGDGPVRFTEPGTPQRFSWAILPYLSLSVFDPENPLRADLGLRAQADYRLAPGLIASGSVTTKLAGNLDEIDNDEPTGLPRVRTDAPHYSREGNPAIRHLTLTGYGRPGRNLYGRVTAGYLETMYAGISGEVLWKPVDSRLALGAEVNYVQKRDFDQLFGLRDYEVVTGHASAYYDFGNGFHGQLDVGRYLAGDYGATLSLDREFDNGWRVGAYATFTDADVEDFGEGSFDKGIRITIPTSWSIGSASRLDNDLVIKSLTRDGGARLDVRDRLYEQVRDYHQPEINATWGRFWR